jgi:hypothetical protein
MILKKGNNKITELPTILVIEERKTLFIVFINKFLANGCNLVKG